MGDFRLEMLEYQTIQNKAQQNFMKKDPLV